MIQPPNHPTTQQPNHLLYGRRTTRLWTALATIQTIKKRVHFATMEFHDMRRIGYGQLMTLFLLPAASLATETPSDSLARLKSVGREGAGNEAAARAWKEVVAQGPAVLPAVLQAMDEADAASSNRLRTAGDAIVERTLAAVKPLPTQALEQFIRQTRHKGAARRLAYEWLCRVDRQTPDR